MRLIRSSCLCLCILALGLAMGAVAQAQAPAAAPPAAPAAAPPSTSAELAAAAAKAPSTADLAKGDPGGTITGTISDVPVSDSKVGLTVPDVATQVGQNKIAINFVWTLVTGFLVMFMQAGFAFVEAGLCRVKNANHTYMMNFFVYTAGLFSYWLIGFAIQMGGAAGNGNLGGLQSAHWIRDPNGRGGRQRKLGWSPVFDSRTHDIAVRDDLGPFRRGRSLLGRPHV